MDRMWFFSKIEIGVIKRFFHLYSTEENLKHIFQYSSPYLDLLSVKFPTV